MEKYIDKKMFVTLIIVGVALFFLEHWLTTRVIGKDGKLNVFLGNDALGHIAVQPK